MKACRKRHLLEEGRGREGGREGRKDREGDEELKNTDRNFNTGGKGGAKRERREDR